MRLLFEIDKKDYNKNGTSFVRPSVRGIIIKDGKIAMVHSLKYDYYKFPGGGIKAGEEHRETLLREVKEETGLRVYPDSVKEYGLVHRIQKGMKEDMFIQDNYYYFCDAENDVEEQELDDYEAEEKFTLEFVVPQYAIDVNKISIVVVAEQVNEVYSIMLERDSRILEMLMEEGYC